MQDRLGLKTSNRSQAQGSEAIECELCGHVTRDESCTRRQLEQAKQDKSEIKLLKQQVETLQRRLHESELERAMAREMERTCAITSGRNGRREDKWTCPVCTLINDYRRTTCEVCESRPKIRDSEWDVRTFRKEDIVCD